MFALSKEQIAQLIQGYFTSEEFDLVIDTMEDLKQSILDDMKTIHLKGDSNMHAFFLRARDVVRELACNGLANSLTHFGESPTEISGFNKALLYSQMELEKMNVMSQGQSWSIISHNLSHINNNPLLHVMLCNSLTEDTSLLPNPYNFDSICKPVKFKNTSTCFILNDIYDTSTEIMNCNCGVIDILGIFYEINSWHFNLFMNWARKKLPHFHIDFNNPIEKALFTQFKTQTELADTNRFIFQQINSEVLSNLTSLMRLWIALNLLKHGVPFPCYNKNEQTQKKFNTMKGKWRSILVSTKVGYEFRNLNGIDKMIMSINEMGMFPHCGYLSTLIWKTMKGELMTSSETVKAIDKLNLYLDRAEFILMGTKSSVYDWKLS